MKIIKSTLAFFCLLILLGLSTSCVQETKPDYKSFIVQVDSVQISNSITPNTLFDIYFYGIVGTNSCYEFSHFMTEKSDNEIIIEPLGKQDLGSEICASVMVYLNGERLSYVIEESGDYLLKIRKPDNSFLIKEITVE